MGLAVVRRQPHHATLLYRVNPEILELRRRRWQGLAREELVAD
jgi:hypothetical protein